MRIYEIMHFKLLLENKFARGVSDHRSTFTAAQVVLTTVVTTFIFKVILVALVLNHFAP